MRSRFKEATLSRSNMVMLCILRFRVTDSSNISLTLKRYISHVCRTVRRELLSELGYRASRLCAARCESARILINDPRRISYALDNHHYFAGFVGIRVWICWAGGRQFGAHPARHRSHCSSASVGSRAKSLTFLGCFLSESESDRGGPTPAGKLFSSVRRHLFCGI